MTTYSTGNPIGSFDTRDRADNTQNLDLLVNGTAQSYPDRLGVSRKSWKGFEVDFAAFLAASGFELPALDYVDGTPLVVARPTQLIDRDGILYSVKPTESFPATLTGTWATDQTRVVVRTDQDLRQDLADVTGDPEKGAGIPTFDDEVEYVEGSVGARILALIQEITTLDYFVTPFQFGAIGNGIANDTTAVQSAITLAQTEGRTVDLRGGNFLVTDLSSTGVDILSTQPGASLIASGTAVTIIDVSGSISFKWMNFTFDGAGTSARAFRITAAGDVNFQNVGIKNFTQRVGFFEKDVASALIQGGVVQDCTSADVYCYKARNGKFRAIHFKDCTEHVIRFGRFDGDPAFIAIDNSVIGCTFLNILNDPVLYELDSRGGIVSGNTFRGCRRIVKIETTTAANTRDFLIENNSFVGQAGVPLEAIRALGVIRCTIIGNHIDGAQQGISVGGQSRVVGNYLRTIADWGIRFDIACIIADNNLDAVLGAGIRSDTTASNGATITGNVLTSITGNGIDILATNTTVTGNRVTSAAIGIRGTTDATYALVTANNVRGSATGITLSGTASVNANNIV